MNELAIPQEPYQVYHKNEWKPITELFHYYAEHFDDVSKRARECYHLAMGYRELSASQKESDQKAAEGILLTLHAHLKKVSFFPVYKNNNPKKLKTIIDKLNNYYYFYADYSKGQKEAADATLRFVRACTILQDLYIHGIPTEVPENDLKKFKEEIDELSSRFNNKTPNYNDGTAITLAETFCRGTQKLENWILQQFYNTVYIHGKLVKTGDASSPIYKVLEDIHKEAIGIKENFDTFTKESKNLLTKKDFAKYTTDPEGFTFDVRKKNMPGPDPSRDIKYSQCKMMWKLSHNPDKHYKSVYALADFVLRMNDEWDKEKYKGENLFRYTTNSQKNHNVRTQLVARFKSYCRDKIYPTFPT